MKQKTMKGGKKIQIKNAVAMQKFAAEMARELIAQPLGKHAKVISLTGNLGAGKTTFTQGFLRELGVRRRIISPTFLIIRPYDLKADEYARAFHIDCYRLQKPQELAALGFKEILENPANIVLIEWPEIVSELLPREIVRIAIEHPESGSTRKVQIANSKA